jgi:Na+-translocating ferredoxin:NAD+ oxidoreductase subunit E
VNAQSTTNRVAPLLMLCPLLAVSDSVINALGLSIVAIIVTSIASLPMSLTLQRLPEYGRIAAVVVIASGVVTSALLMIHAWFYDLYLAIGAYVPLLVAGGLMITRYDVVTPREHRHTLIYAGLRTGLSFSVALLSLGAAREFIGHGSLFYGVHALPIAWLNQLQMQLFHADLGFVLATLPPGAFIAMGILFAVRNWYITRKQ